MGGHPPPELHDYLISLRPYPEGNYALSFLGQIANPAKHESVLTINVSKGGIAFSNGSLKPQAPGAEKDGEFYLLSTPPGVRMPQLDVKLQFAFKKRPEKPMLGFAKVMEIYVRQFAGIVDGIEAVTIRSLAARG
jgi:hypothetical protein